MHNHTQKTNARAGRTAVCGMIALFVIAMIAAGCADRDAEAVVERRDITAYLPLEGQVYVPPASEANVVPPYEGTVERVLVTVGAQVRQGDALMELDAPQREVYYEQARRRLAGAKQSLAQAKQQYGAQFRQAQAELSQARQAERTARQNARSIPEATTGQVQIIETTDPELDAAIARRKAAEQAVLDARAYMASALAPYEQHAVSAQQEFEDAQAGLRVASVKTPISGTVLEIRARTGEVVKRNDKDPVAHVVDLSAVTVYAEVPKDQLEQVKAKSPAVVTSPEVPGVNFRGEIEQVYSQKAGFLKGIEYIAVVDFRNTKGQAKPGMKASASVKIGAVEDVLAVPATAVYEAGGKRAVNIRRGDEWRQRVVEIGLSDGKYTEIRSGLEEGDVVQANPG